MPSVVTKPFHTILSYGLRLVFFGYSIGIDSTSLKKIKKVQRMSEIPVSRHRCVSCEKVHVAINTSTQAEPHSVWRQATVSHRWFPLIKADSHVSAS